MHAVVSYAQDSSLTRPRMVFMVNWASVVKFWEIPHPVTYGTVACWIFSAKDIFLAFSRKPSKRSKVQPYTSIELTKQAPHCLCTAFVRIRSELLELTCFRKSSWTNKKLLAILTLTTYMSGNAANHHRTPEHLWIHLDIFPYVWTTLDTQYWIYTSGHSCKLYSPCAYIKIWNQLPTYNLFFIVYF